MKTTLGRIWGLWCCVAILACSSRSGFTQATDPAGSQPKPPKPKLEIYGFAMMDAGYDFKQVDPDWFDVVRPVKLPARQDQFGADGNTYFSVRQTRFGAKTEVPTDAGPIKDNLRI